MIYEYEGKKVKVEDIQLNELSPEQKAKLTKVVKPTIVEPTEYKNESNSKEQPIQRRVGNRSRKG